MCVTITLTKYMTPEQFTYWLQGFFEINGGETHLSIAQVQIIADHLQTVFNKITPGSKPKEILQDQLDRISGSGPVHVPYYPPIAVPNAVPMPIWNPQTPNYTPIWSQGQATCSSGNGQTRGSQGVCNAGATGNANAAGGGC